MIISVSKLLFSGEYYNFMIMCTFNAKSTSPVFYILSVCITLTLAYERGMGYFQISPRLLIEEMGPICLNRINPEEFIYLF